MTEINIEESAYIVWILMIFSSLPTFGYIYGGPILCLFVGIVSAGVFYARREQLRPISRSAAIIFLTLLHAGFGIYLAARRLDAGGEEHFAIGFVLTLFGVFIFAIPFLMWIKAQRFKEQAGTSVDREET